MSERLCCRCDRIPCRGESVTRYLSVSGYWYIVSYLEKNVKHYFRIMIHNRAMDAAVILVRKNYTWAILPEKSSAGNPGYDVRLPRKLVLPGEATVVVDMGWGLYIPPPYSVQQRAASGLYQRYKIKALEWEHADLVGQVETHTVTIRNLSQVKKTLNAGTIVQQLVPRKPVVAPPSEVVIQITPRLEYDTNTVDNLGPVSDT